MAEDFWFKISVSPILEKLVRVSKIFESYDWKASVNEKCQEETALIFNHVFSV